VCKAVTSRTPSLNLSLRCWRRSFI